MDSQDSERVKIEKPVASRPRPSTLKSFKELVSGAIDEIPESSPPSALVPIRPKTIRFNQTANRLQATNSTVESSGTEKCHPAEIVPKLDAEPTVIYKPLARLVSKDTASLLAKMGNFGSPDQGMQVLQPFGQHNDDQSAASGGAETCQAGESLLNVGAPSTTEVDQKYNRAVASCDRPSYDGYNWRKYGQKQVKGSEYPRSYYKCTHPGCPVKKKVERSLDGDITEIVYKGEHNHLKPQPAKRGSSCQPDDPAVDGIGQDDVKLISSHEALGRLDNEMETGVAADSDFAFLGQGSTRCDHSAGDTLGQAGAVQASFLGLSGEEDGSKGKESAKFEPRSKRRKGENRPEEEAVLAEQDALDPSSVKQNLADTTRLSDGFRWRKYGQKVVKGNPYPRSYYKCTSLKCDVKKYVERVADDPGSFVTTYEGKHNHEMPSRSNNKNASNS